LDPIFKDPLHQSGYEKNGFVVAGFFSKEAVDGLLALYHETTPGGKNGFHSTLHHASVAYRENVFKTAAMYAKDGIDRLFTDHYAITGSFVVKEPDTQSSVHLHQDWNLTPEPEQPAFNIWVPLTDTEFHNGALHVLPGSHRLRQTYRGTGLPDPCDLIRDIPFSRLQAVPAKAGQAIIYDVRTLHTSPPNLSGKTRVACAVGAVSRSTQLLHYRLDAEAGQIAEYAITPEFFTAFENTPRFWERWAIRNTTEFLPQNVRQFQKAELAALLKPVSLWQRITGFKK
jgi:hypothetical protein